MKELIKLKGIRHVETPPGTTIFKKWIEWVPDQEIKAKLTDFSYKCDCGNSEIIIDHSGDTLRCSKCKYLGVLPTKYSKKAAQTLSKPQSTIQDTAIKATGCVGCRRKKR